MSKKNLTNLDHIEQCVEKIKILKPLIPKIVRDDFEEELFLIRCQMEQLIKSMIKSQCDYEVVQHDKH